MAHECEQSIPDSVVFDEILVRLPAKPLCVFKSVCKTWLQTIESGPFTASHRRHHRHEYSDRILFSPFRSVPDSTTNSSYLLPSTHYSVGSDLIKTTPKQLDLMLPSELTRLDWPPGPTAKGLEPWRASVIALGPIRTTGIYCLVTSLRRDSDCRFPIAKISICNPATRDYKLVNPFPPEEMTARLLNCRVHHGFGLAADGDYKVVLIVNSGQRHSSFLSYVYTLKQGSWRKIVDSDNDMVSRLDLRGNPCFPELNGHCTELCPQVFLNGCWHWMARFSDRTCSILSFNVDKEGFKLLYGPPSYRGCLLTFEAGLTKGWVSVLNDRLAALYYTLDLDGDYCVISVWMMMEYGDEESWIKVSTVSPQCNPIVKLVGILYSSRESGSGKSCIHIDRILFQDCREQLVSCDEFGGLEQQPGFDASSCMFWNNLGISAYSETLERLSTFKNNS